MAGSRLVFLLIVLFGLPIASHAAGRFYQKEVDAAIKSFLAAQKSEQEDTDSLGSAISDLNADGLSEIVLLWVRLGPTYSSSTLTVFSKTAAGYKPAASLDLPGIAKKLSSVKDGIILVDLDVFAKNDPLCCPSIPKQVKYHWLDKKISEVKKPTRSR